jgi:hypothetical protein
MEAWMKRLLIGTSLLAGLACPAFATNYNTLAIDATGNGSDSGVSSLAITQSAGTSGNTVSQSGGFGAGAAQLPIRGTWQNIAINQTGNKNTLKGGIKATLGSTTASLTAGYSTSSTGANVHTLTIGGTTAPANPAVAVNVSNDGSTDNTIADTLDGSGLNYHLTLAGHGNSVTNTVSTGASGSVTLDLGSTSDYGITGNGNTVANTLTSTGGSGNVSHALLITGDSNSVTNTVTATGDITVTQGGTGYGIVGSGNTVTNTIGGVTPVTSFSHQLTLSGDDNSVTNTADGVGATTINQHLAGSSNNTVVTNMSGGGAQTSNLTADGSTYLDYGMTSAAANSYANIAVSGVSGSSGTPAVVRVEQTSAADNATANLTVNGNSYTMGTLSGSLPSSAYIYSGPSQNSATPGVLVYQASSNAYLNATMTAASNGFTGKFVQ